MYKSLPAIILCFLLASCRQKEKFDESRYRIVFKEWNWAKIDLKSQTLTANFYDLKSIDTLDFTPLEKQKISRSFSESDLADLKGTFKYEPYTTIEPPFYTTIEIFKDGKLSSMLKINNQCNRSDPNILVFGQGYRAIQFRDVINNILKKNRKYIKAHELYLKYLNDHHISYL
ncbi:hypothetical protein FO440_03335 [Mucilaginibacter corticis]|uniref:Lipoprotein n=1 Tax=Mucilaginibacter corticis TaxID=2597670 RepID=A0A556MTH6_9SPHI|nr:hypothetical protein [Mucilaginibacter corticis]TSJ43240.1 hypothetical protein FO440_03335 [Mucilaginibacter corticis]